MRETLVVDGGQLKRLMNTCRMICAHKGVMVRELQAKLRTSRRTIFRDLNSLEKMGIDVELGDQGYRIKESAAQCKKLLAENQIKSLNKLLASCLK
ncbi:MAG: HTH domain-containing protein [Phycisphaerae bacterium]|nr:HTH domain-containing protein [Phycisphaerae bacterium]